MIPVIYSVFACLVFVSSAIAEPVPGTSVIVIPPEGFTKAERFPGFMNEAIGASIMISEIPGPFIEATGGFDDPKKIEAQGMKLLNKSSVMAGGRSAILLDIEQFAYGTMFKKWLLAVDRSGSTALIVATYPSAANKGLAEQLKEAVLGVSFGEISDPKEALSFTVMPSPPFEIAKIMGQTLIMSVNGEFPVKDENLPFMILALSPNKDNVISDKKAFAENVVKQTATVKNITIQRTEPIKIDSLMGYAIVAEGIGGKEKTPLTLYQVILYDPVGHSAILGLTPSAKRDVYMPIFEKVAKTFALKARRSE